MVETKDKSTFEEISKAAEFLQQIARPLFNAILIVIPTFIKFGRVTYKFYKRLPIVYVELIVGFVMCFMGGFYPTVFAAIQAAEHGGLTTVRKSLSILSKEIMIIIDENKKDNETDDDGDGKNDVDQISNHEFIQRKVSLVLRKMNPEKVNDAIASIYTVWMSVLAVLTIEFARTIALALTIGNFTQKLMNRFVAPIIDKATPAEYKKWVPVLMDWFCKGSGISIAWMIQTVISAFTSAIAGGLIISRAVLQIVDKKRDHQDTVVDEVTSYVFAAIGFYFQFYVGFRTPFPLNVILSPVQLLEYYIRWAVTK